MFVGHTTSKQRLAKRTYIVSLEVFATERIVVGFSKLEGLQNLRIRMFRKLIEDQFNSNIAFELFVRLKAVTSVQFTVVKTIVKSHFSS